MDPQHPPYGEGADDTYGHTIRGRGADAERDETQDTEGHAGRVRFADAEQDDTDDVAGHGSDSLGARRKAITEPDR